MRDVYFDPFGSYTSGLEHGINQQLNIEQQTRANRGVDWNYNNINPITLETAQRDNTFYRDFEPQRREQANLALQGLRRQNATGELGFQQGVGQITGVTQPWLDTVNNYNHFTMPATGVPGQYNYVDAQGRVVGTQNDPGQQILNYWGYDKARAEAIQNQAMLQSNFGNEMTANKFGLDLYTNPLYAQANYMNAVRNAGGGAAGGQYYNFTGYTPNGQPAQPTQPTQPAQPAQATQPVQPTQGMIPYAPTPPGTGLPPWLMNLARGL
jgi:hypothetical protein